MYYKIENKDCEVYQKLHELRTNELRMEEENKAAINEKVGMEWDVFFGYDGQQNFHRVARYKGFKFKEPEKVDLKIWKPSKERSDIFEPNRKTAIGKEMSKFLLNGLQKSCYIDLLDILQLDNLGKFIFPYVEIIEDIIIMYLDDKHEPSDENIIEITKKEFYILFDKN